jgi:ElaB/YqjD/DUF883 family membrane-anchored ribosome-binding protein
MDYCVSRRSVEQAQKGAENAKETTSNLLSNTAQTAGDAYNAAKSKVSEGVAAAQDYGNQAAQTASDKAAGAKDSSGQVSA